MATVRIEFETDNAAFNENGGSGYCIEVEYVLQQAIDGISRPLKFFNLRDSNGNIVGKVTVE